MQQNIKQRAKRIERWLEEGQDPVVTFTWILALLPLIGLFIFPFGNPSLELGFLGPIAVLLILPVLGVIVLIDTHKSFVSAKLLL